MSDNMHIYPDTVAQQTVNRIERNYCQSCVQKEKGCEVHRAYMQGCVNCPIPKQFQKRNIRIGNTETQEVICADYQTTQPQQLEDLPGKTQAEKRLAQITLKKSRSLTKE